MDIQKSVGIEFQAIRFDNDLIELCVFGWNGSFGGTVALYEGIGDLEQAAEQLRGFPRNPTDGRELIFGNFDPKYAGGGVKMRFHCIGGAAHSHVEVTLLSGSQSAGTKQTALLSIPVEAAAIDTFVQELNALGVNRTGKAYLHGRH
jgi:hypothetical protein